MQEVGKVPKVNVTVLVKIACFADEVALQFAQVCTIIIPCCTVHTVHDLEVVGG